MITTLYSTVNIAPGDRFGRLVAVHRARKLKHDRIHWLMQCDCGVSKEISSRNLVPSKGRPGTQSCGCLQKEAMRAQKGVPKTHGGTDSPEYVPWQQMKNRCLNQNSPSWARYGGRGIEVCPEWLDSFEQFWEDVGRRPSPQHSLDRIDPDGHYEPGNVRWATPKEQRNNRSEAPLFSEESFQGDPGRPEKAKPHEKLKPGQWIWRGKLRNR